MFLSAISLFYPGASTNLAGYYEDAMIFANSCEQLIENENIDFGYDDFVLSDAIISKDVYSPEGSNQYGLYVFSDDSFVLLNKATYSVEEFGSNNNNVFSYYLNEDYLLYHNGHHFYCDTNNYSFVCLDTPIVQFSSLFDEWNLLGDFPYRTFYNHQFDSISNAIGNVFFFKHLRGNYSFASPEENVCTLIASEIYLDYWDTFYNDNIIPEEAEIKSVGNSASNDFSLFYPSPHIGLINNDSFKNFLIQKSINEIYIDPRTNGLTANNTRQLLNNYLENALSPYYINSFFNNCGNNVTHTIEYAIDNGRPVIAGARNHAVVIFGYDNDCFYCDLGTHATAKCPKNIFNDGGYCLDYCFDYVPHVHSDNYVHQPSNTCYCGCGQLTSKTFFMTPSDWGFQSQYFFYNKRVDFSQNELYVTTNRLRTGYIEDEVVNLSPRRQGAGNAYFEISFNKPIKRLSVDLAWWSQYEYQTDGVARIFCKDSFGNWILNFVDLHSLLLNTSRSNRSKFIFDLPTDDDYYGIKFFLQNQAVGDRNKGRLSIGDLEIQYYE